MAEKKAKKPAKKPAKKKASKPVEIPASTRENYGPVCYTKADDRAAACKLIEEHGFMLGRDEGDRVVVVAAPQAYRSYRGE